MTTIHEVIQYLEQIAPRGLQESYDNSGLICGDRQMVVEGVMVSLDALESVVDEAIAHGANLVVSHHPILFSGLKSLTGSNYIERTILKAIKHDIALYAIHTNLDNVLQHGVNQRLATEIGLEDLSILAPKKTLAKFNISVSELLKEDVYSMLRESLAHDVHHFGVEIAALKEIEVVGPSHIQGAVEQVCQQYKLSYQQHEISSSAASQIGAGLVGHLTLPMTEDQFFNYAERKASCSCRSTHEI